MHNSDQRMIQRQAEIITELRKENYRLMQKASDHLQAYKMYMLLQSAIISDDRLMSAWQDFISTAILINPEIEGIDSPIIEKEYMF